MRYELNKQTINELILIIKDDSVAEKLKRSLEFDEIKVKGIYSTKKHAVELSEHEVDVILNDLSDALSVFGVGSDGDINSHGYEIEKLIDIFNVF